MKNKIFLLMALTLSALLSIGSYQASYAHQIDIKSTWRELGDEATIELPNLAGRLEQAFQVGDPVRIELGYNGDLFTEFDGYVAEISPRYPFRLTCMDGAWQLKRRQVNGGQGASWRSITLRALLTELGGDYGITFSESIPDVTLTGFTIEKGATLYEAIEQVKEAYLLAAYFRGNTLFVGLPYTEFSPSDTEAERSAGRWANYDFQRNIISDDLTYRRAADLRLKARAVSIQPDNTRIEVEVGDADGEERTLTYRNLREGELRALATADLERYRYDGYKGSFETFGLPRVIHSATASIADARYPDRAGRYVVDQVTTTWGTNGFRRSVELGKKV